MLRTDYPANAHVYLVGGAVRDRLLGLAVHERDWVVTGTTPAAMQAAGFTPVGRDFPVFLHPRTREEVALARTERKQGRGYHGFVFHADETVRLEQDLVRRDLTINALAEDGDGRIVDVCGGRDDLRDRWLRHIGPAFVEDPLRLVRLARFASRFAPLGFRIHPDTTALLLRIVDSGELSSLAPERCWQETRRGLLQARPEVFFDSLSSVDALGVVLPVDLKARFDPAAASRALRRMVGVSSQVCLRLAAWLSGGGTQAGDIPSLTEHLRLPRQLSQWLTRSLRVTQLDTSPDALMAMLEGLDVWRQPQHLDAHLLWLRWRFGGAMAFWRALDDAVTAMNRIDARGLVAEGLKGPEVGAALKRQRQACLEALPAFKGA